MPVLKSVDIARRAETGRLMTNGDFTVSALGRNVAELQRKYQLRYDPAVLMECDAQLAHRAWSAGRELLERTGVFVSSSRRVIAFTAEDIEDALDAAGSELVLGEPPDAVSMSPDGIPLVFSGPFNAITDDRWFLPLNECFARERAIDVLHIPGSLAEFHGQPFRPESALAVEAAAFYGRQAREAVARAGRPGMPIVGHVFMALGEVAASHGGWGLRASDGRAVAFTQDLVLEDHQLARISHYRHFGTPVFLAFTPLIAGPGPSSDPAAAAIIAVASAIASACLGCRVAHFGPQHARLRQQANPQSIWCASLVARAVRNHSRLLLVTSHTTGAGPGTPQYAYEFTASLLASATAGVHVAGPRPAESPHRNAVSPLMARLFARVARGARELPPGQADGLARELLSRFSDRMAVGIAPAGLPFEELYDVQALVPRDEHVSLYEQLETELGGLGIPLPPARGSGG
ncbi:MAG: monomethylamine:corrinoid methyltransferase [Bacillota bacterium]